MVFAYSGFVVAWGVVFAHFAAGVLVLFAYLTEMLTKKVFSALFGPGFGDFHLLYVVFYHVFDVRIECVTVCIIIAEVIFLSGHGFF
jgi:hypothetical protein